MRLWKHEFATWKTSQNLGEVANAGNGKDSQDGF